MPTPRRSLPTLAVALVLAVAVATPVVAQEDAPGVLTWVAYSRTNPNQTEAAVAMLLEDEAFMDGLMADGTILGWGIATPINHSPGDLWNFVQWVHVENWTKLDAWVNASVAKMRAEDPATREAMRARAAEIWVEGSHFDEVVRHAMADFQADRTDLNPRYLYMAEFTARPDREEDLVRFFKSDVRPVLDRLVADGTLSGYGLFAPELHLASTWTHRAWYAMSDLGKMDAMLAAFRGMSAESGSVADDVIDPHGHYDTIWMILHLGRP